MWLRWEELFGSVTCLSKNSSKQVWWHSSSQICPNIVSITTATVFTGPNWLKKWLSLMIQVNDMALLCFCFFFSWLGLARVSLETNKCLNGPWDHWGPKAPIPASWHGKLLWCKTGGHFYNILCSILFSVCRGLARGMSSEVFEPWWLSLTHSEITTSFLTPETSLLTQVQAHLPGFSWVCELTQHSELLQQLHWGKKCCYLWDSFLTHNYFPHNH